MVAISRVLKAATVEPTVTNLLRYWKYTWKKGDPTHTEVFTIVKRPTETIVGIQSATTPYTAN